jgi:hypothetical protein
MTSIHQPNWGAIAVAFAVGLTGISGAAEAGGDRQPIIVLASAVTGTPAAQHADKTTQALKGETEPDDASEPKPDLPVWSPRQSRGKPAAREGGASRSAGEAFEVRTLVPRLDEAALTLSAQPNLFFALRPGTRHAVNFTLVDPDAIEPLVDVMLSGPFEAGIHRIALADYGVSLEAERDYEWYLAVVPDPQRRSADSVARGALRRVSDPELQGRIAALGSGEAATLLAAEGIWYDALATLSEPLDAQPQAAARIKAHDALLEQAGFGAMDGP